MRREYWRTARQMLAVAALSAAAIGMLAASVSAARAADLDVGYYPPVNPQPQVVVCPIGGETVKLFDKERRPTVPARTPYFYCATGETLLPGEIPPPPEYCCY
ncbi:hypothetical protein [Afifella aestuarii]|uniref:hypothetical protein n=1 Tax=Afifella aestuarii TaxID=1909496 RepID=UPI000FE3AB10|nr:hypothetical protein [Afifella aestuarii]